MSRKRKLAVIDFETDPFEYDREPKPFCCGFYDGDTYEHFWGKDCADRVADYIQDKNLNVYAHNGGKFDFFFLLHRAGEDISVFNYRIAKMMIGKAVLKDSYLILPLPLSAHKKDSIDYSIMEKKNRDKEENRAEILKYLMSDCVYLYEWIDNFQSRFGKGLTLPSAAFDQLSKTGYTIEKTSQEYDFIFREFYYGGRTQAFKGGSFSGKYTIVDINSAYPYAMKVEHPTGDKYITTTELPPTGVYFAKIKAVARGCLPFKEDGKLIFPTDNEIREYNVSSWEIIAGIETGTLDVKEVIFCHVFLSTQNFSSYVDKFYKMKADAKKVNDKDNETFAKLMLNSCYGRFALNPEKYRAFKLLDRNHVPFETEEEYNRLIWKCDSQNEFGMSVWSRPDPGNTYYNVATAASITGFVRAYLWRSICASKNVLYCDTDSLVCKKFAGRVGDGLGEWKIEGVTKQVYIGGKKIYAMQLIDDTWKTACKGARLTRKEIVRVIKNKETIEWRNKAPSFSLVRPTRFIKRKIKRTDS